MCGSSGRRPGAVAGIFLTAMGDVTRKKGLTASLVMNIFTDHAYELREEVCFLNFTESLENVLCMRQMEFY